MDWLWLVDSLTVWVILSCTAGAGWIARSLMDRDSVRLWETLEILTTHGDVHLEWKDDGRCHLSTDLAEVEDIYTIGETPEQAIDKARAIIDANKQQS